MLNLYSLISTKDELKKHKDVCEKHNHCCVEMPSEDNKILKYNQEEKSAKAEFIIYLDLESLLEKVSTCHNNTINP